MNNAMQAAAYFLLAELESNRLEVIKVGHCRVVISSNAQWYRRFCARYQQPRKRYPRPRTIIKRQHTIAALKDIAYNGRSGKLTYLSRLQPFLEEMQAQAA